MSTESLEDLLSGGNDFTYDDEDMIEGLEKSGQEPDPNLEPDPNPEPDAEPNTESDPEPDPNSKSDTESDPTPVEGIKEYYDFLVENNMLLTDDDYVFDGTAKGLSSAMEQTAVNQQKAVALSLWEQLPDDFKPILHYGLTGGNSVKEFLQTYMMDPVDVSTADLEDPYVQDEIIREYYRQTTQYTDDKIEKLLTLMKEKGQEEFLDEVYETAVELKNIQEQNRKELIKKEQHLKASNLENIKKEREEIYNIIDDMETTPQRKNMIKSFIYSENSKGSRMDSVIQSIMQNKEHFTQLADILMDYDPKKGFVLDDRMSKKGKTNAVKDLEKKLAEKFSDSKSKVSGSHSTSSPDNFDWSAIFS